MQTMTFPGFDPNRHFVKIVVNSDVPFWFELFHLLPRIVKRTPIMSAERRKQSNVQQQRRDGKWQVFGSDCPD